MGCFAQWNASQQPCLHWRRVKQTMAFAKQAEFALKRLVYAILRMFIHVEHPAIPLAEGRLKRVLILRNDRLGDMVVSQPAMRYLAAKGVLIDVLATSRNVALLDDADFVQERFIMSSTVWDFVKLVRRLRRQQYDAVLCMVFYRSTSAGLLAHLVAPGALVIGRYNDARHELYAALFSVSVRMETTHSTMVEYLVLLCSALYGHEFREVDVDYQISVRPERHVAMQTMLRQFCPEPFLLFNISAGADNRNIGIELGHRLLTELLDIIPSHRVVIFCVPQHRPIAQQLACINASRCVVLPDIPHILDVCALMARSSMCLTPDTSLVHIADSLSIPLLAYYIGENFDWLPTKTIYESVRCDPRDNTIQNMSIDEFRTALTRLAERAGIK